MIAYAYDGRVTDSSSVAPILSIYAYDAFLIHCDRGVYDPVYDYDVTRCTRGITSSTSGTTTFYGDAGITDNACCLPYPAAGHEQEPADSGMSYYGYRYYVCSRECIVAHSYRSGATAAAVRRRARRGS